MPDPIFQKPSSPVALSKRVTSIASTVAGFEMSQVRLEGLMSGRVGDFLSKAFAATLEPEITAEDTRMAALWREVAASCEKTSQGGVLDETTLVSLGMCLERWRDYLTDVAIYKDGSAASGMEDFVRVSGLGRSLELFRHWVREGDISPLAESVSKAAIAGLAEATLPVSPAASGPAVTALLPFIDQAGVLPLLLNQVFDESGYRALTDAILSADGLQEFPLSRLGYGGFPEMFHLAHAKGWKLSESTFRHLSSSLAASPDSSLLLSVATLIPDTATLPLVTGILTSSARAPEYIKIKPISQAMHFHSGESWKRLARSGLDKVNLASTTSSNKEEFAQALIEGFGRLQGLTKADLLPFLASPAVPVRAAALQISVSLSPPGRVR